jgi:CPA2 family monovalent cation:H+ antiporter-2
MEGALELTGITIVVLAAVVCGMAMTRLRQPAIVGYILAGVILGPSGLEFVGSREQVQILAELGVLLLLYFIGMELSLRSFRRMWRIAVLTTLTQITLSVSVAILVTNFLGWPSSQAILLGFVLALSSTAVAVRMLDDIGELRTRAGRITVGVLIAQDLAVAPMLLVISGMSGGSVNFWIFVKIAASILLLTTAIMFLSGRRKIRLPFAQLLVTKRDLAPLTALCWCFGCAAVAGLTGLSPAFGAFMAGLVVGNSAQRQLAYETTKPIESVLMMAFFLSIGLLIDLPFIWKNLTLVLLLWLFITVFKTALNMSVLHLLGQRWRVAFLSSVVLAQLGEFSFVLGAAAIDHAIITSDISRLVVAVTVLSLVSSPLYMASARRLQHRAMGRADTLSQLLQLVYFREWRATRQVTARAVGATKQAATKARAFRSKDDATPPSDGDADAPALERQDTDASNSAETASKEPADGEDNAELQDRTPTPRSHRGNRRGGARTVGGAGDGGGDDPEPGDVSENTGGTS